MKTNIEQHKNLIDKNKELWERKPLLRKVYIELYQTMKKYLSTDPGVVVELGSGMGSITEVLPNCVRTDLFPYPWLDSVENAYNLSFESESVSNLLMVDVFHHLRYPGNALKEFLRVLPAGGRVIMMEPGLGVMGRLIYEWFHVEPVGKPQEITWEAPANWDSSDMDYYAAQGNATWIFEKRLFMGKIKDWNLIEVREIAALTYAASGGYSGPQLYPTSAYRFIKSFEKVLQFLPKLFATRLLVVLEKK